MDFVTGILRLALGIAMAAGVYLLIYKRHAVRWEELAQAYGRPWLAPKARRRCRQLVLYTEGEPARTYAGVVKIGLYEDGIGLKMNPVLMPFHPPLFVPFADVQAWRQRWYLNARSVELAFARRPHLRIIMPREQVAWIAEHAGVALPISDERPETGTWPWLTFAWACLSGVMATGLIAVVLITQRDSLGRFLAALIERLIG